MYICRITKNHICQNYRFILRLRIMIFLILVLEYDCVLYRFSAEYDHIDVAVEIDTCYDYI